MMYWNGHMSTAGWILSVLWTLIIVALVIAGIVWLVSTLSNREVRGTQSSTSVREILDRRLASGEITVEQYQQLRETLSGEHEGNPSRTAVTPSPPPQRSADAPG
jgi:uncharacterized membrane protein